MTTLAALPVAADVIAAAVSGRQYRRLLGWPRGAEISSGLLEHERRARTWYALHARPFVATRRVRLEALSPDSATFEYGVRLRSARLAERLETGRAHALVAVALSAGPEAAAEAGRLWQAGRPDEAYFLDRFAAAAAESLVGHTASHLCAGLRPRRERLLPHLSPGCGGWDLADQQPLLGLLAGASPAALVPDDAGTRFGPLTLMPTGALHPAHSLLVAFGITDLAVRVRPSAACRACDLQPCNFRRVPMARPDAGRRVTS